MVTPEVISIGNMLVEVMRVNLDEPLDHSGSFTGPYPSGDTPIYIDTAARLGLSAGFIGAVGADDFGACLLNRFKADQVDTTYVDVRADYTTGVAFVAYFGDGSRKFIYHWRHAAAGQLNPTQVHPAYFASAKWLHLTGCNLAICESARDACYRAMDCLPADGTLSFDPNIRPEVLSVEQIRALCQPVLDRANVFLPSAGEAKLFTGAESDVAGCQQLAENGKTVVLKMGAEGCRIFKNDTDIQVPAFRVSEVDPTGAGDSFCAGFTVATLNGLDLYHAGRFANAVGAIAVTKKGPMEGAPWRKEVERLLASI